MDLDLSGLLRSIKEVSWLNYYKARLWSTRFCELWNKVPLNRNFEKSTGRMFCFLCFGILYSFFKIIFDFSIISKALRKKHWSINSNTAQRSVTTLEIENGSANRSLVTLFYSLETLPLDGAVFFWPRVKILSKKLSIVKKQTAYCFFDKIKALLSFLPINGA